MGLKYFLQLNNLINEILASTLIPKTDKVEFLSLKWKEGERVQNLNYFNFLFVPQGSPRRIQRIWKLQI